jgi:hypothetical protein
MKIGRALFFMIYENVEIKLFLILKPIFIKKAIIRKFNEDSDARYRNMKAQYDDQINELQKTFSLNNNNLLGKIAKLEHENDVK